MRRARFVLCCALAAGILVGGVAAQTRVDAPRTAAAEQAFRAAIDALESASGDHLENRIPAAVSSAGALLTQRGVLWTRAGPSRDALVIAPVRSGSRLNEIGWSLDRSVGGLRLLFDPRALKKENAGALYDEDAHELLISAEEVATGKVSDYLAHEIMHAQNFHALTRGEDNLFMGWIASRGTASHFHSTYPHLFSLDELQAYARQARVNILALDRGRADADLDGTIEMLDSGAQLARAAAATSRRAVEVIASFSASPATRSAIAESRLIDGVVVKATVYKAAKRKVYFHRARLPDRIANPPMVMRAVIEFDDLQLELLVPKAFPPVHAEALAMILRRVQLLAERSQRIFAAFLELQALVEQGEFRLARERSNVLLKLARRT